jgi:hypothetical protein
MDGRRFGPPHDTQRDRLMSVAAKAFHFEIEIRFRTANTMMSTTIGQTR